MRRLLLLSLALSFSACSCNTQKQKKTAGIVVVQVEGGSDVVQNDTSLNFGESCQASPDVPTVTKTVTLKNSGQNPIAVTKVELTGVSKASFSLDPSTPAPTSVDPLGSAVMKVVFAPVTTGPQSATLAITTDDEVHPVVSVRLIGNGSSRAAKPTFASACDSDQDNVSCRFLNFADTGVGAANSAVLHLTNNGCPPLKVTSIAILPASPPIGTDAELAFTFQGTPPSEANPLTIAGGASQDLTFDFRPTAVDGYGAVALITTNGVGVNAGSPDLPDGGAVNEHQFAVALNGQGVQASISLSPSDCNFSDSASLCTPQPVAANIEAHFNIHNAGGSDLQVTGVGFTDGGSTSFTLPDATTFTVAAHGDQALRVLYDQSQCFARNTLVVESSAGRATARLTAGGAPVLATSPAVILDFGNEPAGTYDAGASLTLSNAGPCPLSVSGLTLSAPGAAADGGDLPCPSFTLDSAGAPFTVAASGNRTLSLSHHPTRVGGATACQLLIASDDPARPDGYGVSLVAKTWINCVPGAVESPNGSVTFAFPDGGTVLTVDGAGSYDPGDGDPTGHSCTDGQSQGIARWDWTLITDPNANLPDGGSSSHLEALPGAGASVCKRTASNGQCTELVVSNTNADPHAAFKPEDSQVNVVLDPSIRGRVNLYKLQLKVTDASPFADGGFVSPADNLNISVQ